MDSKTKGRGRAAASAPTEEARKVAAKSKAEEVEEPEPEAEEEEAVEESESSSDHEDEDEDEDEDDEAEPREDADGNDDPLADLSDAEDEEDLAAKLRREAEKYREALAQRGVVYLSRVPPYMKPNKVRHLLSQVADIERIYLAPEDAATRKRRLRKGGNRKVMFTEGWIEFKDKKEAKRVALLLNNTPVEGKKRGFYANDLWNLKYLSKFQWHHLTEKLAYEKRLAAQRLRAELALARKDQEFYVAQAEKAKSLGRVEKRKVAEAVARGEISAQDAATGRVLPASVTDERAKIRRSFAQKPVLDDAEYESSAATLRHFLPSSGAGRAAGGGGVGGGGDRKRKDREGRGEEGSKRGRREE